MGNLTENTQYGNSSTGSNLAHFPTLVKTLQQKSTAAAGSTLKGSIDAHFNPNDYAVFGSGQNASEQSNVGLPPDQPFVAQTPGVKTQPLPQGYYQFAPADQNENWVNPSDKAQIRNWTGSDEGGQYIVDPTQPGKLVKSVRQIMEEDINPGAKQAVLGKLSPRLYQVDHIVPLWLGGADTLGNLQAISIETHERKTAVQAVALTLLANKKITLDQAKLMALTYKSKDSKGIPVPSDAYDEKNHIPAGQLSLAVAEKYAKKWEDDMKPSFFRDVAKYFGESFKENMANFGKDVPILGEFSKGLVGGTGVIPATEALPESGTLGKVSNFAGNLVTTIVGIGLVSKALGSIGAFGKAAKAASTPLLKYSGSGIKAIDSLTGIGKATIAANEEAVAARLAKLTEESISKGLGIADVGNVAKVGKWTGTGKSMYQSALSLAVFGQLGLLGREMTGQEKLDFGTNVKQAASDIVFGSLLGSASRFGNGGQSLPGYAWVGGSTVSWSLMQGASPEDALKDGIVMTALHGMGYRKGETGPKEQALHDEVYKEALTVPSEYFPDTFAPHQKGAPVPNTFVIEPAKLDALNQRAAEFKQNNPDHPYSIHGGELKTTTDALYFSQEEAIQRVFDLQARSKGLISQGEVEKEVTRIVTSFNELRNQSLPPGEQRNDKKMKDLQSLSARMRPQLGVQGYREAVNSSEAFKDIDFKAVDKAYNKSATDNNFLIKEKTHIVGAGEKLSNEANKTAQEIATGKDEKGNRVFYKDYAIGEMSKGTQSFMRRIWIEQQRNPKNVGAGKPLGTRIENPDKSVHWFGVQTDPQGNVIALKEVGYSPQAESYTKKDSVNKYYNEMDTRLQNILEIHKNDPKGIKKALDADKVMKGTRNKLKGNVSLETAEQISKRLMGGEKIPTDELVSIINAPNALVKYDASVNNVTISDLMKDHDSNYIVGNFSKKWQKGGQELFGEPRENRAKSDVYLEIEGMHIPGKEAKAVVSPLPAREKIAGLLSAGKSEVSKQKVQNTIKAVKDLPKVSETPPTTAELPLKMTQETSKPVEPTKVLTPKERDRITYKDLENTINDITKKATDEGRSVGSGRTEKENKKEYAQVSGLIKQMGEIMRKYRKLPKFSSSGDSSKTPYESPFSGETYEEQGRPSELAETTEQTSGLEEAHRMAEEMKSPEISTDQKDELRQKISDLAGNFEIKSPVTEQKIMSLLDETPVVEKKTQDQRLADKWGLSIKPDKTGQWLNLEMKKGQAVFSEDFLKSNPSFKGKTPAEVFGTEFTKDMKAFEFAKTIASRSFLRTINKNAMSSNPEIQIGGKILKETFKQLTAGAKTKSPAMNWTFNSLVKERGPLMKKFFSEINPQTGYSTDQPTDRLIKSTEGASPKEIAKIDEETNSSVEPTGRLTEEELSTKGMNPEDIKDSSITTATQLDKQKDLLMFESDMPSLMYKNLTGKNPPIEAVAKDFSTFAWQFVKEWNKKLKSQGKKGIFVDLKKIQQKALEEVKSKQ